MKDEAFAVCLAALSMCDECCSEPCLLWDPAGSLVQMSALLRGDLQWLQSQAGSAGCDSRPLVLGSFLGPAGQLWSL